MGEKKVPSPLSLHPPPTQPPSPPPPQPLNRFIPLFICVFQSSCFFFVFLTPLVTNQQRTGGHCHPRHHTHTHTHTHTPVSCTVQYTHTHTPRGGGSQSHTHRPSRCISCDSHTLLRLALKFMSCPHTPLTLPPQPPAVAAHRLPPSLPPPPFLGKGSQSL